MLIGKVGTKQQVPELASYVGRFTDCNPVEDSFYVEIMDDELQRYGCLVFYEPEHARDGKMIKIGAAVGKGTWGRRGLADFICIRWVALWTAFVYLGCDHIQAYVKPSNTPSIQMMELMKFKCLGNVVLNGIDCLHYRLEG